LLQQSFALFAWREMSGFVPKPLGLVRKAVLARLGFLESATFLHALLLPDQRNGGSATGVLITERR
jgi:hypothetical protein